MESGSPPSRAVPPDLPTRDSVAEWSRTEPVDAVMSLAVRLDEVTRHAAELARERGELARRVEELERSRRLDGTNSGRPPSSDGLKKRRAGERRTKSLRRKSGRRSGGRKGHPGTTLRQTENPDGIVDHRPDTCPDCGHSLSPEDSEGHATRRAFDLPPPPPLHVTEHRRHTCICRGCGARTRGEFPDGVPAPVQHGPGITAAATYLQTVHCIPEARLSRIFRDMFGVGIASATPSRLIAGKAAGMSSVADAIMEALRGPEVPVKHLDETGLRVAGRLRWLHVTCSDMMSRFRLGSGRGDVPRDIKGIAVHDNLASYGNLADATHALCNAHHLREFDAVAGLDGEGWAKGMARILLDGLKAADAARERGADAVEPKVIAELGRRFDACCDEAIAFHEARPLPAPKEGKRGRRKRRKGHDLAIRLRKHGEAVLPFLNDLIVPFTNNEAERDLRMSRVRQKVSGCFRTVEGAEAYCILRTVVETARKRGWDIMETLAMRPDRLIRRLGLA